MCVEVPRGVACGGTDLAKNITCGGTDLPKKFLGMSQQFGGRCICTRPFIRRDLVSFESTLNTDETYTYRHMP